MELGIGAYLLIGAFLLVGIGLIWLGIWLVTRMYGKHSVEISAECIDINIHDSYHETRDDDGLTTVVVKDLKLPIYRYWYHGKEYVSQPILASNRKGYKPQLGKCYIRINPAHPERIYSTERKAAAKLLVGIGIMYLAIVVIAVAIVLPNI